MAQDITLPGQYDANSEAFTISNTTKAKVLIDVLPARVVASASGEVALPGEASTRQIILRGGQRITDGQITSTDSVDRSLVLYVGQQSTAYADMGVAGTVATSGQIVVSRTVGSFKTDNLPVGCGVMLFGNVTGANDGIIGQVTAVTATSLTVNMVGVTVVTETQGAGFRVIKLGQAQRIKVPLNSGNSDTISSVSLIGYSGDARKDSGIFLGANSVLVGAMAASISALPAQVCVTWHVGMY